MTEGDRDGKPDLCPFHKAEQEQAALHPSEHEWFRLEFETGTTTPFSSQVVGAREDQAWERANSNEDNGQETRDWLIQTRTGIWGETEEALNYAESEAVEERQGDPANHREDDPDDFYHQPHELLHSSKTLELI